MDDSTNIPDVSKLATERTIDGQLDLRQQNRNVIVYVSLIALTYLAAPVLYLANRTVFSFYNPLTLKIFGRYNLREIQRHSPNP
jgi:hypothetical protein